METGQECFRQQKLFCQGIRKLLERAIFVERLLKNNNGQLLFVSFFDILKFDLKTLKENDSLILGTCFEKKSWIRK